jgi:hypothetical protein
MSVAQPLLRNDRARNVCQDKSSISFNVLCANIDFDCGCGKPAAARLKYVFHVHAGSETQTFLRVFNYL